MERYHRCNRTLFYPLSFLFPALRGGTCAADVVGSIPAFQAGRTGSKPVRRSNPRKGTDLLKTRGRRVIRSIRELSSSGARCAKWESDAARPQRASVQVRQFPPNPVVRAGTYLTRAVPDGAAFDIFEGVHMACKYIELCPSASGWCNRNVENFEECIPFLISAAQHAKEHRVAFECDRRACDHCSPWCHHTFNIRHAKNFEVCNAGGDTIFQEVIIDE